MLVRRSRNRPKGTEDHGGPEDTWCWWAACARHRSNRQLAELAIESAPDGVSAAVVRPAGRTAVLQRGHRRRRRWPSPCRRCALAAAEADAALVVTPEYNGSIPGVLKNAIDWLSRPFGNGALKGKPLAVIGGPRWASTAACGRTTRPASRSASPVPRVVEDVKLSVPFKSLEGKHPRENAEVVQQCATWSASWSPRSADRQRRDEPPASTGQGSSAALLWMTRCGCVSVGGGRAIACSTTRVVVVTCDTPGDERSEAYDQGISSMSFRTSCISSECRPLGVVSCRPTDPRTHQVKRTGRSFRNPACRVARPPVGAASGIRNSHGSPDC